MSVCDVVISVCDAEFFFQLAYSVNIRIPKNFFNRIKTSHIPLSIYIFEITIEPLFSDNFGEMHVRVQVRVVKKSVSEKVLTLNNNFLLFYTLNLKHNPQRLLYQIVRSIHIF